jgi:hypothetical protein
MWVFSLGLHRRMHKPRVDMRIVYHGCAREILGSESARKKGVCATDGKARLGYHISGPSTSKTFPALICGLCCRVRRVAHPPSYQHTRVLESCDSS